MQYFLSHHSGGVLLDILTYGLIMALVLGKSVLSYRIIFPASSQHPKRTRKGNDGVYLRSLKFQDQTLALGKMVGDERLELPTSSV